MSDYWDDVNFPDYFNWGLLILRLALAGMLVYHGYNKLTSLDGTAKWFSALGLHPGAVHARMATATEIGASIILAAGFITPAACAAFIGLMTTAAITDHKGKGFFVFKGGWEYAGMVGLVAAIIALVGPGEYSIDGALGWSLYGWLWFVLAIVVGVVAGVGLVFGSKKMFPTEPAPKGV